MNRDHKYSLVLYTYSIGGLGSQDRRVRLGVSESLFQLFCAGIQFRCRVLGGFRFLATDDRNRGNFEGPRRWNGHLR